MNSALDEELVYMCMYKIYFILIHCTFKANKPDESHKTVNNNNNGTFCHEDSEKSSNTLQASLRRASIWNRKIMVYVYLTQRKFGNLEFTRKPFLFNENYIRETLSLIERF